MRLHLSCSIKSSWLNGLIPEEPSPLRAPRGAGTRLPGPMSRPGSVLVRTHLPPVPLTILSVYHPTPAKGKCAGCALRREETSSEAKTKRNFITGDTLSGVFRSFTLRLQHSARLPSASVKTLSSETDAMQAKATSSVSTTLNPTNIHGRDSRLCHPIKVNSSTCRSGASTSVPPRSVPRLASSRLAQGKKVAGRRDQQKESINEI
ncbi:hypothetical protein E2C01_042101 [Portunus trituberculatus]|uniref:Uncharacterized protein n=1 Tax=Portunus trituberculatus TaxID=210409 RepID=A0A5B7FPA8_PORTR|nr:hypothetical protein [Portunus trituberculatus]